MACEAAPIRGEDWKRREEPHDVFVVVIGDFRTSSQKIGAIYHTEGKARQEVGRLNKANRWTRAYYVHRTLMLPIAKDLP